MQQQEKNTCPICGRTDCENTINGYYPDDCSQKHEVVFNSNTISEKTVAVSIITVLVVGFLSYHYYEWKGLLLTEIPLLIGIILEFRDILKK